MTRLHSQLSPEHAAAVYEACLHDVVHSVYENSPEFSPEIWYDPEEDAAGAEQYFRRSFPGVALMAQPKGDLGTRLSEAFGRSFSGGARRVAIIGSDAPTLPPERIPQAFRHLGARDVVLGPAEDGGYYLIGIRAAAWPAAAGLFGGVPWSTDEVLSATRSRLRRLELGSAMLAPWYDIDHPEDLARAAAALESRPGSHLGALLAEQ